MIYPLVPDVRSGYVLDPERGLFAVLVPEAATNLVTNPSLETASSGYAAAGSASVARSAVVQRRGVYGLQVTPTSATGDGAYYGTVSTTAGTTYTASLDVKGAPGVRYRLYFASTAGAILGTPRGFRGTGRWQRVHVTYAETQSASRRVYLTKEGDASTRAFFLDGLMVTATGYPTTYVDGDQAGCRWTGARHASTSVRSAGSRQGGREVRLLEVGFKTTAVLGLGMAPLANVATPSGLLGGATYQRTIPQARQFQIVGLVEAKSAKELERKKQAVIDLLKPDLTPVQQPLVLRYHPPGADEWEEGVEIEAVYAGGLEGNVTNHYQERLALEFTAYRPTVRAAGEAAAALAMGQAIAETTPLRRDADGWSALGSGVAVVGNAIVYALVEGPSGEIYAGGNFTTAGGNAANFIAKWDGANWSALGSGMNGVVTDLVVGPDGTLYAAGQFTTAGGNSANHVAAWNGVSWSALGTGMNDDVFALAVAPDGTLYAGGDFTEADGNAANRVAAWNGVSWSALGDGVGARVNALAVGPDGTLYAGGQFTEAGGNSANRVAKWDGSEWSALGAGMNGTVNALAIGLDGTLYAGGSFTTAGGNSASLVAAWNGVSWSALGDGLTGDLFFFIESLAVAPDGTLYAGGNFTGTGGGLDFPDAVARWNGSGWFPLDLDLAGDVEVRSILIASDGALSIGFQRTTATAAAVTTVTVGGTAETAPTITFTGPGTVYTLFNETTGKRLHFDLTLLAGEVATLDLTPGSVRFTSSFRGNVLGAVLPGSDLLTFTLAPGENALSLLVSGSDANTAATLRWREQHWATSGAVS